MAALYVTSMGEEAGKSALCAGLGRRLQAEGKKVGYLKPVSIHAERGDRDAELMKQFLNLEEPVESLCPVALGAADLASSSGKGTPSWLKEVEKAYTGVSKGKDMVMLEGVGGFDAGSELAQVDSKIVEALKVKAILIIRYQVAIEADKIVAAAKMLGDHLLGVVINAVPERRMEMVKANIVPSLEKSDIEVLGMLPEDRALLSVTVGELAEHIGGSILSSQDRSDELVESLMVGAMSVDSALTYLTLKPNKAVITRSDRPDIQLAALETSTKCLVLTGNIAPAPNIISRAQELAVPIVSVDKDTPGTMAAIEGVFDKAAVYNDKKLERMGQLLEQHLDMEAIYQTA